MKILILPIFLSILLFQSFSQTDCVDLSSYDNTYLNTMSNDDVTYPPGTAFITSGDIQYVKPDVMSTYQMIYSDSLLYIGNLDLDVSTSSCTNKTLTFTIWFVNEMSIDGELVYTNSIIPTSYVGNGFTVSSVTQGNDKIFTVSGDFDVVSLLGSTNFIFDVCLSCNTTNPTECVSLAAYDDQYLMTMSNDDVTYPPGTAFITSGDIQYVKPDVMSTYQMIYSDSLLYIGNLDLDVSTSTCTNKTLTFTIWFVNEMSIDGELVYTNSIIPTSYVGNGFTVSSVTQGNDKIFTVSGDFDVVSLLGSTNFIFDVCLSCNTTNPTECVSLAAYDDQYLMTMSNDDVTYPPGTAFITSGDIQYVKPDLTSMYQFIQGDSLLYIGNLDIDISSSPCTDRTLTFSAIYLEEMSIDGEIIFDNLNPPSTFTGTGFYLTQEIVDNHFEYIVTGDFDVVSLFGSTNYLFDVCLACNTAGLEQNISSNKTFNLFPNPSNNELNIETNNEQGFDFTISSTNGMVLQTGKAFDNSIQLNISILPSGIYFVQLNFGDGQLYNKKLVKN